MLALTLIVFIIGICLVGVFSFVRVKHGGIKGLVSKTAASLLFVFVGVFAVGAAESHSRALPLLVIAGLVCGLIGDVFLDLKNVDKPNEKIYFVSGVASFFLGHIFYIVAISLITKYVFVPIIIAALLSVILVLIAPKLKLNLKPMQIVCGIYCFILLAMTGVGFTSVFQNGDEAFCVLFAIAGVLFTASDFVLCYMLFSDKNNDAAMAETTQNLSENTEPKTEVTAKTDTENNAEISADTAAEAAAASDENVQKNGSENTVKAAAKRVQKPQLIKPKNNAALTLVNHITYYGAQYLIALALLFI